MNDKDERLWNNCLAKARTFSDHYSMSEMQQFLLWTIVKQLDQPTVTELGVCNGKTACVLLDATRHAKGEYIGIDNWSLENSYAAVDAKLQEFYSDYSNKWCLVQEQTQKVFKFSRERPPTFLVIDAGHDEENIREDCKAWIPLLASGSYIAFHDYDGLVDPASCHEAVRRNADAWTGSWELIAAWFGLIVRRKP